MILALMRQGARIITPNNRLARELLTDYVKLNYQPISAKPFCMPYGGFLTQLFNQHTNHNPQRVSPILLTSHQLYYIWQQVIDKQNNNIASPTLINELQNAWEHCQRWQLDINQVSFASTNQSSQFQHWVLQLEKYLLQRHLIADCQLVNFLLNQQTAVKPITIVWHCFNDYTPEQQVLHDYLIKQGCDLIHTDVTDITNQQLACYAANDSRDEYQQLIIWLKQQLIDNVKRIGVVIPNLQQERPILQRLLRQHFDKDDINISLGMPLIDYSLVAHGLCWLSLNGTTMSNHQLRLLFYSPYLGASQTEMLQRMQAMQDCVSLQENLISQTLLLAELANTTPTLVKLLRYMPLFPEKASPNAWVDLFLMRLAYLNFPGEISLDSTNYQCLERFLALFSEFKQLHLLTDNMSQQEALLSIQTLATQVIFQPETRTAKINVLGELEASGMTFDSLWITGLTDECLPSKARLSAFIPIGLQHKHSLPHANPTHELLLAQKTVERFKRSSLRCIVSYPMHGRDKLNLPNPFIRNLPAFIPTVIPLRRLSQLERYQESYSLPLALQEKVIGGTSLLANQAKCPFKAFAAHRLHAKKAPSVSDGLTLQERGQIIHKIMELLWTKLTNQATLLALPTDELNQLIHNAIIKTLEPYQRLRQYSFPNLIKTIEFNRLSTLVRLSLAWDKQRPAFVIEALEQAFTITLAGLNFNVRIDRLDRLTSGKKWVIDYKSTIPSMLPWRQERPKEPQLVLYALLDETIAALVFSGLKEGHLTNKGLSDESIHLNGIYTIKKDETWDYYRLQWHQQLEGLANEYHQGQCLPQPLSAVTCQYCDYQSLCRFKL
jgi:ATP-dependent helicase/nuclease subunit B